MKDIERINDILEANTMLAERIESWFEEATRKGMEQGMQKGLQDGMQQGIQQGLQDGMQQGRAEGRTEGEASLLARLLERRFGPLPQATLDRLAAADLAQIEAWGDAVLTAPTLEAVFAATPGH